MNSRSGEPGIGRDFQEARAGGGGGGEGVAVHVADGLPGMGVPKSRDALCSRGCFEVRIRIWGCDGSSACGPGS